MKNFIYFSIFLFFTLSLLSCNSDRTNNSQTRRTDTNRNNYNNRNYNDRNYNDRNTYTNNTSRSTRSRDLFSVQCACQTGATPIPVYGQGFSRENAIEDARKDCRNISSEYAVLPNACTVQIYFIEN